MCICLFYMLTIAIVQAHDRTRVEWETNAGARRLTTHIHREGARDALIKMGRVHTHTLA